VFGFDHWRLCVSDETARHSDRRGVMAIRWGNQRSSSCARVITVDPPRLEGQSKSLLSGGAAVGGGSCTRGWASGTACRSGFVLRQGDDPGVETRKLLRPRSRFFLFVRKDRGYLKLLSVGVLEL